MTYRIITPDARGTGDYGELRTRTRDVLIRGTYEFLNLAGADIHGRLVAERGSGAGLVLLSGARMSDGIYLGTMGIGKIHGEGVSTEEFVSGEIGSYLGLSASKIGRVYLGRVKGQIALQVNDSLIRHLFFGNNSDLRLSELDLTDCTILGVSGKFPVRILNLKYLGMEIPEEFKRHLERITRHDILQRV